MKVAELTGALLDMWVARAEGIDVRLSNDKTLAIIADGNNGIGYAPSTRWAEGGPIIEKDQIFIDPPHDAHYNGGPNHGWRRYDHWSATVSARTRRLPPKNDIAKELGLGGVGRGAGETPLIAAMRAKVASHYGDEVPDAG